MKKLIFALMIVSQFAFAAGSQDNSDARLKQLAGDLKFSTVQNAGNGFFGITSCNIETSETMLRNNPYDLQDTNWVPGLLIYVTDLKTQQKLTLEVRSNDNIDDGNEDFPQTKVSTATGGKLDLITEDGRDMQLGTFHKLHVENLHNRIDCQ